MVSKTALRHLHQLEKEADLDGLDQWDAHWLLAIALELEKESSQFALKNDCERNPCPHQDFPRVCSKCSDYVSPSALKEQEKN